MEDSGTLQSLTNLARAGKVDLNRVMVLRTASNFDSPPPGRTAAENLAEENSGLYSAFIPSVEAAYRVGSRVVHELTAHWQRYEKVVPPSSGSSRISPAPYIYKRCSNASFTCARTAPNVRREAVAGADHVRRDGVHPGRQPVDPLAVRVSTRAPSSRRLPSRPPFTTLAMALLTNYPIALAPGMGLNAFFHVHDLPDRQGIPWPAALWGWSSGRDSCSWPSHSRACSQKIVEAIPASLKTAIGCGIGLFIAFIGLKNGENHRPASRKRSSPSAIFSQPGHAARPFWHPAHGGVNRSPGTGGDHPGRPAA